MARRITLDKIFVPMGRLAAAPKVSLAMFDAMYANGVNFLFSRGHFTYPVPRGSSNIESAAYDHVAEILFVRFKEDGVTWAYAKYTLAEAVDFWIAPSHGTWLWDHVLVRGPGNKGKHQRQGWQVS